MTICYGKKIALFYCFLLLGAGVAFGQQSNQIDEDGKPAAEQSFDKDKKDQAIDVNILFNYYQQDGEHAAVTGGTGSESLNDRATKIVINVPLDTITTLHVTSHTNIYTSASTDNIDTNVSSASRHDLRNQLEVGFTKENAQLGNSHHFAFGGSTESDYVSIYSRIGFGKDFQNGNSHFNVNLAAYFDTWLLIFPEELRKPVHSEFITTNRRKTFNFSMNYFSVINKKMQASISSDLVLQYGLLSTPFHRVFYQNSGVGIEKLPGKRIKFPVGIRFNYFFSDINVLRFYYRYYRDTFGIDGHTISAEIPFKLSTSLTMYPFYRFHRQNGSTYFAPTGSHDMLSEFHTSDYDLSSFDSHKIGFGIQLSPIYGIGRFKLLSKEKVTVFQRVDMRFAHYERSDGLKANSLSFNFAFQIR